MTASPSPPLVPLKNSPTAPARVSRRHQVFETHHLSCHWGLLRRARLVAGVRGRQTEIGGAHTRKPGRNRAAAWVCWESPVDRDGLTWLLCHFWDDEDSQKRQGKHQDGTRRAAGVAVVTVMAVVSGLIARIRKQEGFPRRYRVKRPAQSGRF